LHVRDEEILKNTAGIAVVDEPTLNFQALLLQGFYPDMTT
jgi:hypothetical protein